MCKEGNIVVSKTAVTVSGEKLFSPEISEK